MNHTEAWMVLYACIIFLTNIYSKKQNTVELRQDVWTFFDNLSPETSASHLSKTKYTKLDQATKFLTNCFYRTNKSLVYDNGPQFEGVI